MAFVHDCRCEARAKAKADLEAFMDACPENRAVVDSMVMQAHMSAHLKGMFDGKAMEQDMQKWRKESGK